MSATRTGLRRRPVPSSRRSDGILGACALPSRPPPGTARRWIAECAEAARGRPAGSARGSGIAWRKRAPSSMRRRWARRTLVIIGANLRVALEARGRGARTRARGPPTSSASRGSRALGTATRAARGRTTRGPSAWCTAPGARVAPFFSSLRRAPHPDDVPPAPSARACIDMMTDDLDRYGASRARHDRVHLAVERVWQSRPCRCRALWSRAGLPMGVQFVAGFRRRGALFRLGRPARSGPTLGRPKASAKVNVLPRASRAVISVRSRRRRAQWRSCTRL